jgi:hypothetical protein
MLLSVQSISAKYSDTTFSRFRVLVRDGSRFEGNKGVLTATELRGTSTNGKSINIPRENLRALDRSTGTEAGKYGLIGAGLGLLTALMVVIEVNSSSDYFQPQYDQTALVGGFTGGGFLLGLAVGAGCTRWEHVQLETARSGPQSARQQLIKISFRF